MSSLRRNLIFREGSGETTAGRAVNLDPSWQSFTPNEFAAAEQAIRVRGGMNIETGSRPLAAMVLLILDGGDDSFGVLTRRDTVGPITDALPRTDVR